MKETATCRTGELGRSGTNSTVCFGVTRAGDVPTDIKFTGQRLDETGLYYYNARYYDATIGRFISPDTIVPDPTNPQAYNKYGYCVNNPLSAIDPNGKDYIFVCGSGGKPSEWDTMIDSLNIDSSEKVIFVTEPEETFGAIGGSGWEIQDQVTGLESYLLGDLTDIKLIGHSEGAAAIITVLDKLANDDNYLADTNVRNELQAAVMVEGITGILHNVVQGWEDNRYNDLPGRLAKKAPNATLLDVWNAASIVHSTGRMPGWSKSNTYFYNSSWLGSHMHWFFGPIGLLGRWGMTLKYHADPLADSKVIERVKETVGAD
ncbi:RHS repeat-associated core domain-containing protein [bacterium]|nr:RHS repeat-associated core domain-containing protein [bacterium]